VQHSLGRVEDVAATTLSVARLISGERNLDPMKAVNKMRSRNPEEL
jgi:hypothetical protein